MLALLPFLFQVFQYYTHRISHTDSYECRIITFGLARLALKICELMPYFTSIQQQQQQQQSCMVVGGVDPLSTSLPILGFAF